jgi:hypothetical protein
MTNDINRSNDELESIKDENEFKKMKMMLEHGAIFASPQSGEKLPPEIENEFLKNIEKFDAAFHSAKRIPICKFLGNPSFKNEEFIPDADIASSLTNILNLLNENGISLDTICDVDDRTLYKFITEELMLHEIDNMKIEGMMNCFIYEEFHPNHEYNIREHCIDFINSYLDKTDDFYAHFLTKEAEENGQFWTFQNLFNSFTLKDFAIKNINYDSMQATVSFEIDFLGIIENTNEEQHYSGEGIFRLKYIWDYWCIDKIILPKVNVKP